LALFRLRVSVGLESRVNTVLVTSASRALALEHIVFRRDGNLILDDVTLHVEHGQRWVVLGANGSGKSTLMRIAAAYEHATSGSVSVLGETIGRTDVRVLRRRVGYNSASLSLDLRPALSAAEVVMTAKYAALEPWWHEYSDADRARAVECLERLGVGAFADRTLGTLSTGERQRVLLARTLMNDPGVILLDEPSAGLDLGGREQLVAALGELAGNADNPPFVLITHHVDEIPIGTSHALLLRNGRAVAQGPLDEALTSESLSRCFEMTLTLERRPDGRFTAWATAG
jgi:iron complex transport system ATP-binding protein